jgi:Ca-activated chloride channel family protein
MTRTRAVFFAILLAAGGLGAYLLWVGNKPAQPVAPQNPGESSAAPAPAASGAVEVVIANALTKQRWFADLAKNFAAEARKTGKGNTIMITSKPVSSGGSMDDILSGKSKPVVWSPGVASWVQEFDEKWKQQGGQPLMSGPCRPTIYAPLGIAMWRPMAEALGWPDKPIGWKTIVDLAAAPEGWKSFGHPEWGRFKLGYPHPKYSNAGMLFMTAFVYGVEGKSENLQSADVYAPGVEASMRTLAQSTSKYGTLSPDLLDSMAEHGPQFLHAVASYENDTIQYNIDKKDKLRFPLAFIFPSEGTFWTDQPYCIFDKADWVSPEQAEAAKLFLDYLLQPAQQALALKSYMRPLDTSVPLGEPLDLAHGTDPRVKPGTVKSLPIPNADLMRAVTDVFLITKRKATVLVVMDLSGSMQGDKIRTGTIATANFLKRLQPDDVVGVMTFSDKVQMLSEPKPASAVAETLSQQVTNLIAEGGTALYQSVCDAMTKMGELKSADEAAGQNRLYGIVLLSDGKNTGAGKTENQMFETCLPHDAEAQPVRINTIAFGDDADQVTLKRIAEVTGGEMFKAGPDSIDRIYLSISAEQ